ncbi:hypothetical protein [Aeromicrobium sp.]|uniref:hypothetical protein n=1 Tax=Aeromicrobium sp. TaxID=1871063 RepID=UPI00198BC283|nr:hypothetical protein [Aeromicrobium sp.]MBC7632602.1 hypothetical protein [Aeromicrobium sp.]
MFLTSVRVQWVTHRDTRKRDLSAMSTARRKGTEMSVATMLGVYDVEGLSMVEARRNWNSWAETEPSLSSVEDLLRLRAWTRTAGTRARDDALRALAKIGSATGGDDTTAVTALTWVLVPGAATIAHRMSDLTPDIDELVATQLWIACRTFAWQNGRPVAVSILRDTLRGVQAEVRVGDGAWRRDHTWAKTKCVEPARVARLPQPLQPGGDSISVLLEFLSVANEAAVISSIDQRMLIDLAVASEDVPGSGRRGRGGLMTPVASEAVAAKWGMSARTVRRRTSASIDRLAAFATAVANAPGDTVDHAQPFLMSA